MDADSQRWFHGDETVGWKEVINPESGLRVRHVSTDGVSFYFWDETQTAAFGPFDTLAGVKKSLNRYASWLSTGEVE